MGSFVFLPTEPNMFLDFYTSICNKRRNKIGYGGKKKTLVAIRDFRGEFRQYIEKSSKPFFK